MAVASSPRVNRRRSVLPAAIRKANLGDKLHRLAWFSPEDVQAIEALVTAQLERHWRAHFFNGVRGGVALSPTVAAKVI